MTPVVVVPSDDAGAVARAAEEARRLLRKAELVVLPTDTVFGLACRPDLREATERVFDAKGRSEDLALPVLAGSALAAFELGERSALAEALAERFWPGPLTLVLLRTDRSRPWPLGRETGSIALRVPAHPVALAVLERAGPLAVSSANPSGQPPLGSAEELTAAFGDRVALYLVPGDAPREGGGTASTVVSLLDEKPRILRLGSIGAAELRRAAFERVRSDEWVD